MFTVSPPVRWPRTLACVRTPASVLAEILRSDPARPRVTFYEDTPGPTQGERIELSGKTVANWISKAGNALQEEYDLGPGSVVRLSLPPHWRALYWAFAIWSVGGTVDCAGGGPAADLLICDDDEAATSLAPPTGDVVLVTLAALARSHSGPVPPGAMDEARELATYGDQFARRGRPVPRRSGVDHRWRTLGIQKCCATPGLASQHPGESRG